MPQYLQSSTSWATYKVLTTQSVYKKALELPLPDHPGKGPDHPKAGGSSQQNTPGPCDPVPQSDNIDQLVEYVESWEDKFEAMSQSQQNPLPILLV